MYSLICKSSHHIASSIRASPTHSLCFLQTHLFSSSLSSTDHTPNQHSFTVNYLVNSCGFPLEKALSASKYTNFETPNKPDSVLEFFGNHGFTKTQVSKLIRGSPPVLLCNPEKTLLPKIDFLKSKGVSRKDVIKILSTGPTILRRSLENQIIPSFDLLKKLIQSGEKTIAAIKRFPGLLLFDLDTCLLPNIEILREAGVPDANIVVLLTYQPRAFMTSCDKFRESVEKVEEMGFNPLRSKFVLAVHALRALSKLKWEKKVEAYKKWGWSEDEILVAFGKHPWCMTWSEDKIARVMDFFVNNMGWESSLVANRPVLMSLSFEKRIVPRCAVYQALFSKGLIKKTDISLVKMLESRESWFLEKVVNGYEEEAPKLLKLYKEKLALAN
ncbi:uncharacterized protein LOC130763860 [Actinidia eriantha]|uniref:uncharacterized protein LOC130763860 n=1 Tax=Actinidia eriantha TaxID=165200 RepID=UPI00258DA373|nr:uncharacterized protein LOC130763860 [Actinidia eriantha]